MFLRGKWYKLECKDGTYNVVDPVHSLDCQILTDNLLQPILGIGDLRVDDRITYVGGARGTAELERLYVKKKISSRLFFSFHFYKKKKKKIIKGNILNCLFKIDAQEETLGR